jgi:hypothetical protein
VTRSSGKVECDSKPFAQLTIYALALSHLTGIPLFDFKCAWFNEHQYCEFFPRTILARHTPNQVNNRAAFRTDANVTSATFDVFALGYTEKI